jgi:peptide-methionine (S)-S-oxide reductase
MRRSILRKTTALAAAFVFALGFAASAARPAGAAPLERVVLAGGCFWGMEAVFGQLRGVKEAMPGYSGGSRLTANYELVSTGTTGHAESVQITFDPAVISFEQLLRVYFTVATNPTELNYQGPDHGSQYRGVIFYTNDSQKREAQAMIAELGRTHAYPDPIVTQVVPLAAFYAAEPYHRHYIALHPENPYVQEVEMPILANLRERFPKLLVSHS